MLSKYAVAGLIAVSVGLAPLLASSPALAQEISLIRDTEIENDIRVMATPIWEVAGLEPKSIHIILVNDPTLNAFVAIGQNIFIHTGLIIRTVDASQLIGVIAHETGHITGGHLSREPDAYHNALVTSLISMAVGIAAGVAGHSAEPAMVGMLAGQSMASRQLAAHSRGVESAADEAGMKFLDDSQQTSEGFTSFMQVLADQDMLRVGAKQDPYVVDHPLSSERVEYLKAHAKRSPWTHAPIRPDFVIMHKRIKAKLIGFMQPLANTLAAYPESNNSLEARYARAIAYYRIADLKKALPLIDGLIAENPADPYFYELKGQMLFENGKVDEALAPYAKAIELLPSATLFRVDYARVQIESNNPDLLAPAVKQLYDASAREPDLPDLWREMGMAYGKQGDLGNAASALAQEALLEGRKRDARDQALRAMRILPVGSPGWLRAQDVQSAAQRKGDD